MPKVSRVGKKRSAAVAASPLKQSVIDQPNVGSADSSMNTGGKGPESKQNLSRGQRKRMLKREQYLKREQMVLSTLKLKQQEDQKGRLDGLDAIKDALTATIKKSKQLAKEDEASNKNEALKSNKSKKDVAQKELTHLNLVLQHPTFQSNPFATMQEHLKNTLAKQAEQQEIAAKDARVEEAKKAEEKKEARKERIRNAKYEKGRRGRRRRN